MSVKFNMMMKGWAGLAAAAECVRAAPGSRRNLSRKPLPAPESPSGNRPGARE